MLHDVLWKIRFLEVKLQGKRQDTVDWKELEKVQACVMPGAFHYPGTTHSGLPGPF